MQGANRKLVWCGDDLQRRSAAREWPANTRLACYAAAARLRYIYLLTSCYRPAHAAAFFFRADIA
ncbi:hypothetical protein AAV94_12535 [Lampropedia cohaerens]|uniref:Uncharacterized protein n=1 Tax=Lampropedia cohaerens TaxID=1610491 RepID=A0A0U1PX77_9BURK|nr:hypothetical protein AAV94_12535 [Lampropedia cohaerens]